MKSASKIFLLLLIDFQVSLVWAQDSSFLSLHALTQQVETHYPDVVKYQSKINSINARAEGANALMPPTISLSLDRFPYRLDMIKENSPMNQAGIMVTASQMFTNGSKLNARKDYLKSLVEIQRDSAAWTKNILRYRAKFYYYQRYTAEKQLKVLARNEQLLKLLIKSAETNYTYGQAELGTVFKAKAKLSDLENMRSMLQSQVEESSIALNILMQRSPGYKFNIDSTIALQGYETLTFALYTDTLVTGRADIQAMDNSIKSMDLLKKKMSFEKNPDFGVSVSHGQMFGMPNQFSIMGMMTIPVVPWSSKMYTTEVKAMDAEIRYMQIEKEGMQLMVSRMISDRLSMIRYEKQQYDKLKNEIIPNYKKSYDAGMLAYRQNTGNLFIVLDEWEMLLMKEMEAAQKLDKLLKLEAEYEFTIGK